ncbi:MAG: COX15/CtaA family protein [Phycisphaerales bacterium]
MDDRPTQAADSNPDRIVLDQSQAQPDHGLGHAVVGAFAGATTVGIAALIVAAPQLQIPPMVGGPILLLAWLESAASKARRLPAARRVLLSIASGVGTALLLLIFLGSLLGSTAPTGEAGAEPETIANVLRQGAPLIVGGVLVLGAVMGTLGGLIAPHLPRQGPSRWPWVARLALWTALAAAPLLLLGGLVTSTESGMAVPDWPGSYGWNMVLFPIGLMSEPRVFLEHSHRLFGVLVGVSTIATALAVQFSRAGRAAPRSAAIVAWACLVMVIVQGVLGGTRVTENSPALGVFHGVLAQVFVTSLACLCAMLLPSWRDRSVPSRGSRRLVVALLIMLLIQLAMGATFRHLGTRAWHALATHVALAFAIVVVAPIAGARLGRTGESLKGQPPAAPGARRAGKGLIHATGLQFLLGWGALAGALMGGDRGPVPLHTQLKSADPVPLWEVLLTTAHQANGALLLVLAGLALAWTWPRRGGDAPIPAPTTTEPAAA